MKSTALQHTHHFLGPFWRAEEISVIDGDEARTAILHFSHHLVDRPIAEFQSVHQWFGAERASLMAASRRLNEGAVHIAILLQKVITRHRHPDHLMQSVRFV